MTDVQDYPSRLGDPASRRHETFSYLPTMDAAGIRKQVRHAVDQGWNPAIEHVEPERSAETYWYMWKLPMFGERKVDLVMREIEACRQANSGHLIRFVAYDNQKQSQGASMVIHRANG